MVDVVLVTGGSRGIGRAVALRAAASGWAVGVNYAKDSAAAEEVVRTIIAGGGRAIAVAGDVADERDVVRLFDETQHAFGMITGVVVNAGIVGTGKPLAEIEADRIRRIFEVNAVGAYLTAREAARRLPIGCGGRGGSVVVVSSVAARLGSPNEYVDYAGSKAALDALAIGLAKELGPGGVRVNAVRPGLIDTEIHASGGYPDRAHVLGKATPLGRAGHADEVASAIVWLLGNEASYVTGAVLDIAGGR